MRARRHCWGVDAGCTGTILTIECIRIAKCHVTMHATDLAAQYTCGSEDSKDIAVFERSSMPARITINTTKDGTFELWLNKEGRDLLVQELLRLNEDHEHLHLAPRLKDAAQMGDIDVCSIPYGKDDTVYEWGKIYLRTDEWDREHFPHVLAPRD